MLEVTLLNLSEGETSARKGRRSDALKGGANPSADIISWEVQATAGFQHRLQRKFVFVKDTKFLAVKDQLQTCLRHKKHKVLSTFLNLPLNYYLSLI